MNRLDKYRSKILKLNEVARLIKRAIALLKEVFKNDNDVGIFIWRLIKASDKLQRFVSKKLERDYINEEVDKMEKRLKEKKDE